MNVTVTSNFNKKTFQDYFFHLLFKRRPAKILRILLIIELVFFVGYLLVNGLLHGSFDQEIFLLGILVVLINASYFLIMLLMGNRLYRKNKEVYTTLTQYHFQNKQFYITLPQHKIEEGVKIGYDKVRFIEESKIYFYVFLENGRAHVIRKEMMAPADVTKLARLLQKHFQSRYMTKYKVKGGKQHA